MFEQYIDNIHINNGGKIEFPKGSLIIITGINNCGKSITLKELYDGMKSNYNDSKIVKHLEVHGTDDKDLAIKWMDSNYQSTGNNNKKSYQFFGNGIGQFRYFGPKEIEQLVPFLGLFITTENRLNITLRKQSINLSHQFPNEYIHLLQNNENILKMINNEINRTFQKNIILNWGGGEWIWFNVGKEPDRTSEIDRVSTEYLEIINKYPELAEEGDGLRSFIGLLMILYSTPHPILMIDEPESYLHPFQSKRLGNILAKSCKENNKQIFIATHSSDIIEGALNSNASVCIVRIERKDNINNFNILNNEMIETYWNRPILRTSNVLNGLFYNGVIVCESDNDCKFYETILNIIQKEKDLSKSPDIHFIHGNGKGKIPDFIRSYRALNIKVSTIVDIDIFRDMGEFKKLYTSLLNDFTSIEDEYKVIRSLLNKIPSIRTKDELITELEKIVESFRNKPKPTNSDKETISNLLSENSDWSKVKKNGIESISENDKDRVINFLEKMKEIGINIVPVGELESWYDNGLNKSNDKWILKTLDDIILRNKKIIDAENFMIDVIKYFNINIELKGD